MRGCCCVAISRIFWHSHFHCGSTNFFTFVVSFSSWAYTQQRWRVFLFHTAATASSRRHQKIVHHHQKNDTSSHGNFVGWVTDAGLCSCWNSSYTSSTASKQQPPGSLLLFLSAACWTYVPILSQDNNRRLDGEEPKNGVRCARVFIERTSKKRRSRVLLLLLTPKDFLCFFVLNH
jgi:hypothetical protein